MANKRNKAVDNTHLSVDMAEKLMWLHRDYIAHCLRWTHIAKYMHTQNIYKSARILDIGCGKLLPFLTLLYRNKMAIAGEYTGVDVNKIEPPEWVDNLKATVTLIKGEFPKVVTDVNKYDVIICLEVAEHVEPSMTLDILRGIKERLAPGGVAFVSTPCYDAHTGAAANHVNEMSYDAFGSLIEHAGLGIQASYGTFASIKDYKDKMYPEHRASFDALREYYDSNYLSTIFAPLYPQHSRNAIWRLSAEGSPSNLFPPLAGFVDEKHSSSALWTDFVISESPKKSEFKRKTIQKGKK